jgi:hypothetical protein
LFTNIDDFITIKINKIEVLQKMIDFGANKFSRNNRGFLIQTGTLWICPVI